MLYRIGIDIGGTFTDLVIRDTDGHGFSFKTPSTPNNFLDGVKNVIQDVAQHYNLSIQDLLGQTEMIVHGTTASTNAIVQHNAAKTGLLTTDGFTHVLYYKDGGKTDLFNLKMLYPEPYVPLYRTIGIKERIDSEGGVVVPLDEDGVRQAVRQFKKWNVEAIGVSLLWSIVNPDHENRVARIIEEEWPGIPYSLGHQVQPVIREFIRTSAAVLDASLKPVMRTYCRSLQTWLTNNGFKHDFLLVVASGGVMQASEAKEKPVYIIFSGPSVGPMAALSFAKRHGCDNAIVAEMGGTTCDISTIIGGLVTMTSAAMISDFPTGVSSVEVESIGAGGGSIAMVDSGGLLHVGPLSAGANPGPACYDTGGQNPTVTDANVVLGYFNPTYFLGGQMKIVPELAQRVIEEKIARPLKLGVVKAADAIFALTNENMANAIHRLILRHGIDTRDFVFVVGGGGGPTHAAYIAKNIGTNRVILLKRAAVMCAEGMVNLDGRFSITGSFFTSSTNYDADGVNRKLEQLTKLVENQLVTAGFEKGRRKFEYSVAARYPGQIYDLSVTFSKGAAANQQKMAKLFHDAHLKRYRVNQPESPVDFVQWTVIGTGIVDKLILEKQVFGGTDASKALKGKRNAYFGDLDKMIDCPIYDGNKLVTGNVIEGPAIIEDTFSTPVVPSRTKVTVDEYGDYYMELN